MRVVRFFSFYDIDLGTGVIPTFSALYARKTISRTSKPRSLLGVVAWVLYVDATNRRIGTIEPHLSDFNGCETCVNAEIL